MKRTAVVLSVGALALVLTGCSSLGERDCGACCKGVRGLSAQAWEGGK